MFATSQPAPAHPPPLHSVLSKLSNPDARTCQLLADTFTRLTRLYEDSPATVAFTFDKCDNPQILHAKQQQLEALFSAKGPAFMEKLVAAKAKNPDPTRYHLVALVGLEQLVEREKQQEQQLEKIGNVIAQVQKEQESLRETLDLKTKAQLRRLRVQHAALQQQYFRILGLLEDMAMENNAAQIDPELARVLQNEMDSLTESIHKLNATRPRALELRFEVHAAFERIRSSQLSGLSRPVLSDWETSETFDILDKKQEICERLQDTVRSDAEAAQRVLRVASQGSSWKVGR